jgi:uncharacterized membrane protein
MKARFADHPRAGLFLFLAAYACVLVGLLPVLSLWLDEIMDLMVVRRAGMQELLAGVAVNSGNAPLNYIIQFWAVHALGYSAFVGRLPEAIFSLVSCVGVYALARRLELRWPLLAVAVFALFPLQFRYALEARPYSLALALSIWSTVAFFRLLDQPRSLPRAALYTLSVAAGIYVLPFTLFVAVAHLARVRREMLLPVASAIAIAGLAFVPWYLHAVVNWRADPVVTQAHETVTWRVVPMILHEVTGAGYVGAALVIAGVLAAFALGFADRWLWALYLLVPVITALVADAVFGYFPAIRQIIFVLAPLALLFTVGVEALFTRWPTLGLALAAALLITGVAADFNFFHRPREDWRAAAAILASEPCVMYSPAESGPHYSFFIPELAKRNCAGDARRVALVISPYALNNAFTDRQRQLTDAGYVKRAEFNPATPRVEIYVRP